jgi:hypothetical protein
MSGGVHTTRKDDEYVLHLVKLRMQQPAADIARSFGVKSERVRTICNRVLVDDIRASVKDGVETPEQVLSQYWQPQWFGQ